MSAQTAKNSLATKDVQLTFSEISEMRMFRNNHRLRYVTAGTYDIVYKQRAELLAEMEWILFSITQDSYEDALRHIADIKAVAAAAIQRATGEQP